MEYQSSYTKIDDLLFLGEAIDLPYYDFVVGVEEIEPSDGKAYNNGDGKALKARLKNLQRTAILHLSYQPSPPTEVTGSLLKQAGLNFIKSAYGIAVLKPGEIELQVGFVRTPIELLGEDGVVEEDPEKLLKMLQARLQEYE